MTASKLIRDFATRTKLPVDVEEVVTELRARGIKDEIWYYWDAQMDPAILSGYIKLYDVPYGDVIKRCADITYAKMGNETERLVCCKELLHLLDPAQFMVSNKDAIESLIEKIVLPPELVDPVSDGLHALTDRFAVSQAVSVLFPKAARDAYKPAFDRKKVSLRAIADRAELPLRYVAVVMSDQWDDIYADIARVTDQLSDLAAAA